MHIRRIDYIGARNCLRHGDALDAADTAALPAGRSQSSPTPAATANAGGSTTVTYSPERPADTPEGNWIQTTEGKCCFVLLRLDSPLAPFFDKSWRPSEIEP
jgi:hypothetical protein